MVTSNGSLVATKKGGKTPWCQTFMHGNSKNISTTWCKSRLPSNKFTLSLNKGPTEKTKKNALCSPCHETTKDNGSLRATEPSQFMSAFSRNAWSHKHLHPPSLTYSSFQKEWRLEHPTFLLGRSLLEWAILNFQGAYNQKMSPMYYIKFNLLLATPILQTKNKKNTKTKQAKHKSCEKNKQTKNSPYNQPASKTSSNLHLFPTNLGIRIGGGSMLLTQSLGDEIPGIPSATRERSNQRLVDESRMKLSCCYCSFFGDVWNLPLTICIQYI